MKGTWIAVELAHLISVDYVDTAFFPYSDKQARMSCLRLLSAEPLDPVASTTPRGLPARGPRSAPGSDTMKIALKYGIAVTLVIAVWVAVKHFVLHLQGAQFADVAIFNFSAIVGLMLVIKEKRLANGNKLTFGDGFVTGLGIAISVRAAGNGYAARIAGDTFVLNVDEVSAPDGRLPRPEHAAHLRMIELVQR